MAHHIILFLSIYLFVFLGTAVHEFGHFFAATKLTKLNPTRVTIGRLFEFDAIRSAHLKLRLGLFPLLGQVAYSGDEGQPAAPLAREAWGNATARDRAVCALAGPAAQFIVYAAAILVLLSLVSIEEFGLWSVGTYTLCLVECGIALTQLYPTHNSDGGIILRSISDRQIENYSCIFKFLTKSFFILCMALTMLFCLFPIREQGVAALYQLLHP